MVNHVSQLVTFSNDICNVFAKTQENIDRQVGTRSDNVEWNIANTKLADG